MIINQIEGLSSHFYSLASRGKKSASGIAFICKEEESIFLCKRSEKSSFPGTWSIPGGKIEENESPIDAAIREVIEELGSTPDPSMCDVLDADIFDIPSFNYTTFIINVDKEEKNKWIPKLNKEHVKCAWFKFNNLPKNIHPGAKKTIKKITK
jgi:mutator protein MutT